MNTAAVGVERRPRHAFGPDRAVSTTIGIGLAAVGIATIALQAVLRRHEAILAAFVLETSHLAVHAQAVGTSILFPQGHRTIGIDLTPGCASALLLVPFVFVTGATLITGRLRPRRALLTLAAVVMIVVITNQARLATISGAMQVWGVSTGYARGHILIGTLVSTFGVAVGVVVFLVSLTRPADHASRWARRSKVSGL